MYFNYLIQNCNYNSICYVNYQKSKTQKISWLHNDLTCSNMLLIMCYTLVGIVFHI